MTVTLSNTDKVVQIAGVPARVWEGTTDTGIPCHAFITRIAVAKDQDASQFERELQETRPVSALVDLVYPARLVL
jgi:hypothetical protein